MSYHPGRGLSFVSSHTGRRRFVVPCAHCNRVATVTTPKGVRLCDVHSRASRWSHLAVAYLMFGGASFALSVFGVAYLNDDTGQMLLSVAGGLAGVWGGAVAWNEARR